MAKFRTLDDIGEVRGKRVLVREDLNVPMADGAVSDDTRLRAAAPTLLELADAGAKVLVLAHFGRPKGAPDARHSLREVVPALA
ncbi:MAG: phosphoglycerate kinase, partial [Novosphingobium sp.]|nr:phosphoglycerate kinase [Novosphingobium sp.]